ncbi:hypothetical protein D9M73_151600 [compost metagenome]
MQLIAQLVQLLAIIHVQGFDLHAGQCAQGVSFFRIAHGSGYLPAVFMQTLDQAKA